ncbi:MAG: HAD-IB family phosphatase, partial [SAR324 cluster bacterium]|nr:HAD-IB family phosphatase [SAR324 cluster bacterium]
MRRFFIIDFDSTLIQVESLDILAEIALRNCSDREKRLSEVREITASGMEGGLSFSESLKRRIALLEIKRSDIDELVDVLKKEITPSFLEHKNFLQTHADDIYIVTGGFVEYVSPVVELLGLKATNVRANVFQFNEQGIV